MRFANCGGLAQLARALALQARGHRFESDILHHLKAKAWNADFKIFKKIKIFLDY